MDPAEGVALTTTRPGEGSTGIRRPRWSYDLLLAPGAVTLTLLSLLPLVLVLLFSMGTVDIVGRPHLGTSFVNFHLVLDSAYLPVFVRTVVFACLTTLFALVLGYPVAYFANRFAGRWGSVIIVAIVLTWLVDYLVRIYAWTAILAPNGLIHQVAGVFGLSTGSLLGTNPAVLIGLVYTYMPLMILSIYSSLGRLDPALIEAGKDLYGTPRQTFWHVTLPATMPGVVGGILLVLLPTFGDFAAAQFLGGVNSTMIGNLISQSFINTGQITFAAAMTTVLLAMLLVALLLISRLQRGRLTGALLNEEGR